MRFAVIDNNVDPMSPEHGRGRGFFEALDGWVKGKDYEFIRYNQIETAAEEARRCRGLILSGSRYDFARPDDSLDPDTYRKMTPELRLLREFGGPVLGICFGHQLLALTEEFANERTAFGQIRIRNMQEAEDDYLVTRLRLESGLRFSARTELWVQNNHKQEVVPEEALLQRFEILSHSDLCPVQVMQHRFRDWFGVQFHPEIGRDSKQGETDRHDDAVRDGYALIRDFVRYCLK